MLSEKETLHSIHDDLGEIRWSLEGLNILLADSPSYEFISPITRMIEKEFKKQQDRLFQLIQSKEA